MADAGRLPAVDTISWSPTGDLIAAGCSNGKIYLLDSSTAEVKLSLNDHQEHITAVAWSPDGTMLAAAGIWYLKGPPGIVDWPTATTHNSIYIFDAQTGKVKRYLSVDADGMGVDSVSYSPTGDMIAAGCRNGKIYLVDTVTADVKLLLVTSGHGTVRSVSFSPKGDMIAVGCWNETIHLVDVSTSEVKRLRIGHNGQDGCICDCDENGHLASRVKRKCQVSGHTAG